MKLRSIIAAVLLAVSLSSVATTVSAQSETILQTLQRLRPEYPERPTKAELASLLNKVAWIHRGENIVLLGKQGGSNCPQPQTGTLISCDFLVDGNTKHGWDVLQASDETDPNKPAAVPMFGGGEDLTSAIASGARSIVLPVDPGGSVATPTTPTQPPAPSQVPVDLSAILNRIASLEAALAAQQAVQAQRLDAIDLAISGLRATAPVVVPTGCAAAMNLSGFSIPLRCRLTP